MDAELEKMVRELHDKQAIREIMYRNARGIDRRDKELLVSCYHPDAVDDHGMFVGGGADFFDWTWPSHLQYFKSYQHTILNHTCTLEGDVAYAETYFMFAGNPVGDVEILSMSGGRYIDRLEKRKGEWRIAVRKVAVDWLSPGMSLPEWAESYTQVGTSARNRTDMSYDRPLTVDPKRIGIRRGV